MKVTYQGDERFVEVYGIGFQNGKAVTVADDHPYAFKLANNPQFTVSGGEPEVNDDKKALFAEAESLGLEPRANASVETLQKLIDDEHKKREATAARVAQAAKE